MQSADLPRSTSKLRVNANAPVVGFSRPGALYYCLMTGGWPDYFWQTGQ
jgi:hypothetical protein